MIHAVAKIFFTFAGAAAIIGCQSHTAPAPAVLVNTDEDTMRVLHAVLADAMGRAQIELGAGDPTQDSVIAVLPPPLGPGEDRSTATPAYFDLMLKGGDCILVRRETGETFALDGVQCNPL